MMLGTMMRARPMTRMCMGMNGAGDGAGAEVAGGAVVGDVDCG